MGEEEDKKKEEEEEEEEEATPSTIDIKFNYPQTSAFPNHYFVQQSQLLPFKRFQSIQRRRRRGGSNLRPFHLHARSLHHRSTTFSLLFVPERRIHESFHVRAFQEEAFTDLLFSNTRAERGGGRESWGELGRPTLFSVPVSNPFPCIDCAIDRSLFFFSPFLFPILSTIFRTGEVSTVFLFSLSLSLNTLENKIVERRGGEKREREKRRERDRMAITLCTRGFEQKFCLSFLFEMDRYVKKILQILRT